MTNPDVEIVTVCDAYEPAMDRAVGLTGGAAKPVRDYRYVLDNREIDAVVITTPEHWHAIMCIDACDAGKDVYVEKPAAHNIRDGRLMVDAARRNKRVVQVGTQQRSGAHFQRAVRYVQEGRLGDVHYATCWHHSHRSAPPAKVTGGPPPGLDWDLWLGPAPALPYEEVWSVGRRGYWDFWGGMITEWGSHLTDIILWAMQAQAPESVAAVGGLFDRRHGEIPDLLQASYTFPGFVFHYSILGHNTYGLNGDPGAARFGSFGMQFHGTKGTIFVDRSGFRLTPQPRRVQEEDQPPSAGAPDSRQPGLLLHPRCLAGALGDLRAARAPRAQLPRLREEPATAHCRHRRRPSDQCREPPGKYRVPRRSPARVGRPERRGGRRRGGHPARNRDVPGALDSKGALT